MTSSPHGNSDPISSSRPRPWARLRPLNQRQGSLQGQGSLQLSPETHPHPSQTPDGGQQHLGPAGAPAVAPLGTQGPHLRPSAATVAKVEAVLYQMLMSVKNLVLVLVFVRGL